MRLRFGRRSIPSSGTPYAYTEPRALGCGCPDDSRPVYGCMKCGHSRCETHRDLPHSCQFAELEAARDVAVKAALEIAEGVRAALADSACFFGAPPTDVVEGVRRLVWAHRELGRAHGHCAEVKATCGRRADALATELDQVKAALEVSRLSPRSPSDQDRRNARLLCDALALSEGRKFGAPMPDPQAAEELLGKVRQMVSDHLRLERAL